MGGGVYSASVRVDATRKLVDEWRVVGRVKTVMVKRDQHFGVSRERDKIT